VFEELLVLWALVVCRVCEEMVAKLVRWESKVFQVFQAALDPWVSKGPLVPLVLLVQLVFVASKEKLDQMVCVDPQEQLDRQARLACVARLDPRVLKASKDPQESREILDPRVSRATLVLLDLLDHLEPLEHPERMVKMEKLALRALVETVVLKVFEVLLVLQGHKD
jgi:hypothetical protein